MCQQRAPRPRARLPLKQPWCHTVGHRHPKLGSPCTDRRLARPGPLPGLVELFYCAPKNGFFSKKKRRRAVGPLLGVHEGLSAAVLVPAGPGDDGGEHPGRPARPRRPLGLQQRHLLGLAGAEAAVVRGHPQPRGWRSINGHGHAGTVPSGGPAPPDPIAGRAGRWGGRSMGWEVHGKGGLWGRTSMGREVHREGCPLGRRSMGR